MLRIYLSQNLREKSLIKNKLFIDEVGFAILYCYSLRSFSRLTMLRIVCLFWQILHDASLKSLTKINFLLMRSQTGYYNYAEKHDAKMIDDALHRRAVSASVGSAFIFRKSSIKKV